MKSIKKYTGALLIFLNVLKVEAQKPQLTFTGDFSPSDGLVKTIEKPYRDEICLNGSWQFQPVKLPEQFKEGIDLAPPLPEANDANWSLVPIKVPSPWNVNSFADRNGEGGDFNTYPSYPKEWESVKMGWMKKRFSIPQNFKGKVIKLHFEAIAGNVEIWLNGKMVGKNFDLFLPFDLDVTKEARLGQVNELLVGIRKASLFDQRSDHGRRTYQAGSFWGQHIVGIWQDVFVVAEPQVSIENVFVKTLLDQKRLEIEATVVNRGNQAIKLDVASEVAEWLMKRDSMGMPLPGAHLKDNPVLTLRKSITVQAKDTARVIISTPVNGTLKEWAPTQANLYGLVLSLKRKNRILDKKYTRFGWRQTSLEGSQFLLNGQPLTMKGDSWHFMGIPQMTRRYAWAWFKAAKDANLNTVRLHAQPYPSFYMDMADEMGILILDETAVWASDGGPKLGSDTFWKDSENHLQRLVLRDRNHPSVIGWSVSNEVMPIVKGVMRNPPGMKEKLVEYYARWAEICREFDPTRPWISADGEEDGEGKLPVYIVHYGGFGAMDRGEKSGKPWGVGEAGNAYYGTPLQTSETNGERSYESFMGRMEGVAASSYNSLLAQRERNAVYQSVFNLAWYGLKPLPLGKSDLSTPPADNEGVFFTSFVEGKPGVQPERLGPYSTTLNPGYDKSLPLYQTWPLFDAIKDASAEPVKSSKWTNGKSVIQSPVVVKPKKVVVRVLSGKNGLLEENLTRLGVSFNNNHKVIPNILFIDGVNLPQDNVKPEIDKVLAQGGKVFVWGVDNSSLPELNKLLPAPLALTNRKASSLLPVDNSPLFSGLNPSSLYFSELMPAEIVSQGLSGRLVGESSVLLKASNTDWQKWNKQPEYAKTAMIIRSEQEAKPDGNVLISKRVGRGELLVTTLPSSPKLSKGEEMLRILLSNLGLVLSSNEGSGKPLKETGDIVNALVIGSFPAKSLAAGADLNIIKPYEADRIKADGPAGEKVWRKTTSENNIFDFKKFQLDGPQENAVAYMSFWISSPRSLEDLLIEPNIPVVDLEVAADDAVQVWLNGKLIVENIHEGPIESGKATANALKLQQGWNNILIKVIHAKGNWRFYGRLKCNNTEFLNNLESALEKP